VKLDPDRTQYIRTGLVVRWFRQCRGIAKALSATEPDIDDVQKRLTELMYSVMSQLTPDDVRVEND
jgi:hypothetical protein